MKIMSEVSKIKNKKIFHPILVALFPILIIYSQNVGRMNIEELILPVILLVIFSIALYYGIKIVLKNPFKASIIVTLVLIFLFSYGHVYYLLNDVSIDGFDIGRNRYLIPAFTIILGISLFFIIKSNRIFDNATSIMNVISIVFLIVAISNIGFVAAENANCENCENQEIFYEGKDFTKFFEPHTFSISDEQELPDVYYLILDEYARSDALEEYHNFNNQEFVQYLEKKGFDVADNSFTNYPMSVQAIPATMNMNYINFLADEIGADVRNYEPLIGKDFGLYSNNMVIKNFKDMDYKIITFNTFALTLYENKLSDKVFCDREKALLGNKLLDALARTSIFGYYVERWAEAELRQVTLCAFDEFGNAGKVFDEPVFVWAHIMLPHPPWIFGPNGEEITPGKPLLITDNPEFRDAGWQPKLQYTQQVEFANKKTIEVIEKILEHNQNSIIIVQGDHGTAWDLNWKDPGRDDVWQRLRNFNAMYFPDEFKRDSLYEDRTLVNTFRIVFNEYFGSEYEILENKFYWGWNEKPYNFKEMTEYLR